MVGGIAVLPIPSIPPAWAALAVAAVAVGAYAWGRADGRDIEAAVRLREEQIISATREAAQQAAAEAIAGIEIRHVTIRQTLEREIHEKPVYRDCRHSPDGLHALNAALADTEPAGGGQLPAAAAAD